MSITFIRMNRFTVVVALCLLTFQFASGQSPEAASAQRIMEKFDEYMDAAVKIDRFSGSILVARNGSPVISRGYGMANYEWNLPNTPKTVFRLGSITKPFTATAVAILQQRGKLSVGDPICKYLEKCPAAWQPLTIRHLLTMTSGIPNYTSFPIFWSKDSFQPATPASFVDTFRDKPLEFSPGEEYKYSNSGYHLLGLIIERASGMSYADFVRDNIFTPLGMRNSGYDDSRALVANRANGYAWTGKSFANARYLNMMIPYSAGSLYSTTEDLLLWDKALYTEKLISRKSQDEMFTPNKGGYGYGWDIGKKFERQTIGHDGGINGFLTEFVRFPADRVTIIVLSNNEDAPTKKIADSLAAIVFGESYQLPKPPVSDVLSVTITQKGIDAAVQQYRELKRTQPANYNFAESVLNGLGYDLLRTRRVKEAIEIFKLNVEMFPRSANVYDSLGEAYMLNGDRELALKNYEKSLELNPQNTNATEMLKKLREGNDK